MSLQCYIFLSDFQDDVSCCKKFSLKLCLTNSQFYIGCEICRYAKGKKKCTNPRKKVGRMRKSERNSEIKKSRPRVSRVAVEKVFEILFPLEITPSTYDACVAAWSQAEWRNYLQSVTGLRGLCRPGHSFLFSTSVLHARTSTCACFYAMATVCRGRMNCRSGGKSNYQKCA